MWSWIYANLFWLAPTISSIVLTAFIIRVTSKQKNLQKEQNEIQKQNVQTSIEQKEIQKQNVKLAMLERRLNIYTRVREFISFVISNSACTTQDVNEFHRDCRETNILFEDDIYNYVDEFRKKGNKLAYIGKVSENDDSKKLKHLSEEEEILQWFTDQLSNSVTMFDKYINVNKIGL